MLRAAPACPVLLLASLATVAALAAFACMHWPSSVAIHASVLSGTCLKFQSHAERFKQHAGLTLEGEPGRARTEAAPAKALLPAGNDRCKVCNRLEELKLFF